MKNRVIRDRYAALKVLAERVLPATTAINKVDALLRRFEGPYKSTEKGRQKVINDNPVPSTWERDSLPLAISEARNVAMETLLDEDTFVESVPDHLRLTDADLPHVLKREGGADNVMGLAAIRRSLGGLYKPTTTQEKEFLKKPQLKPGEKPAAEQDEYEEHDGPSDPRSPDGEGEAKPKGEDPRAVSG